MTRFGDSANGPSVLDISNISGVSADIDTLAGYTTELSNLGPVSTEIGLLGTAAVIADMSALGTQAVRDDMDALADVTTELGVLGNTTTAGYIAAIGSSTVAGSNPTQLTVDALGQLTSEISLLASNLSTLQASAANSPIQLTNLSDVDFGGNTPSLGNTIVYTSNNKFELQALPGAGPLSGTNLTETSPQTNQILKISAVNAGVPEYVNTTVSALVYDAAFDNITEVAAATPAAAGEVLHYDGTSAWTVGKLDYAEILNTPNLQALATSANFADITEASASGTTGDVIHWNGASWDQGQLASTELSDTSTLVRNNAGSTLTGNYTITGNLDVSQEIRVSTIDPDPDGVPGDGSNPGTLTILGNLQVDGTTTTINSQELLVTDSTIVVAKDATTASAANGAGFEVGNYASNPAFLYDGSSADKFTLNRDLDVGTNQLYFSNVFSTSGDLPAAGSYHGMFAHVHADAAAYYAHNGSWVKLANDTDVVKLNTSPTFGSVYANNGVFVGASQNYFYESGGEVLLRTGTSGAYKFFKLATAAGEFGNSSSATRLIAGTQGAELTLATDGKITLSDYTGAGTHTGTAVKSLAVDASGNVIEEPLGGGASTGFAIAMAIVF